jgi:hypothetical protein
MLVWLLSGLGLFAQTPDELAFFESKVRPVLAGHCFACHSEKAKTPFAGLKLDSRESMLKGGDHGPVLVPGKAGQSRLIEAVRFEGLRMPPTGKLPDDQIAALARWVEMGAPWPKQNASSAVRAPDPMRDTLGHWSWQPPRRWFSAEASIDAFLLKKLEAAGLSFSRPADRRTYIRRLSYDLTGLPPTPEQVDAFLADTSPLAFENLADRLIASPQFGERWARHWLDLARFSDAGFNNVRYPYAFTYRDWVIAAFNEDMPYDRFVMRQLAADQLEGEDEPRHRAALGFLSLGHNPPRTAALPDKIDDRIDTVTRTFLGLTVSCARCHDHKYDPIPTRDYYSLYGVFANTIEPETPAPISESNVPRLDSFYLPRLNERLEIIRKYKEQRIEELRAEAREPEAVKKYLLAAWESWNKTNPQVENISRERNVNLLILRRWLAFLETEAARAFREQSARSPVRAAEDFTAALAGSGFLMRPEAPPNIPLDAFAFVQTEGDFNTVNNLRWQFDRICADYAYRGSTSRAMAVADRTPLTPARVFVRGNMNDQGEEVPRQFLGILAGDQRKPFQRGSGRLDLARAIADPHNPLTARVMVNRIWRHLFGEGIAGTPSDFGVRGDPPTHPELLDWLAVTFQNEGWSTKKLIRRIVLSRAYRQSSADNAAFRARDPENRLLWRMNRRRLDFESLRDTMLFASGRLDLTVGGPSFALAAVPSAPRRAMYAYVERERAQALLKNFNAADPDQHTAQRHLTTVPQQALFLLNSSFAAEQARALAEACADTRCLYRRLFQREPTAEEARLAEPFLSARNQTPPSEDSPAPWQYGYGEFDAEAGGVRKFTRFRYFLNDAWQAGPILPDPEAGAAFLTAAGGSPGDNLKHAVIRRWQATQAGKADITGTLSHTLNQFELRFGLSNGIRAWIVSSRLGVLGTWRFGPPEEWRDAGKTNQRKVSTNLKGVEVAAGDYIDFIVDSLDDYESDDFGWAPEIRMDAERHWKAAKDFRGPQPAPLTPWQQYAQVLLLTNEAAFID